MKKTLSIVLVFVMLLCCSAFAAEITPMIKIDPADFANGTYSVAYSFSETSDTELNVEIYQTDYFDCTMVEALQPGDTIVVGGETITVETVETNEDGWYLINGGFDDSDMGVTLVPEAGEYTTHEWDDSQSMTLQGTATFTLADTVKLQHFVWDETDGLTEEFTDEDLAAADVKNAIEEAGLEGYPTSFTITDGKIEIILITYAP